jgi:hypothetical protein
MLTSEQLKKIRAEARPYIQRQMEDAKIIAGFREVVSAGGGDWGALKAVIKAEIQDEDDEGGNNKKIGKIADKAEWTRIYLDMLGLGSNLNEKNSFAEGDDELAGLEALDPKLLHMLIEGAKTKAGLAIISAALAAVQEPNPASPDPSGVAADAEEQALSSDAGSSAPITSVVSVETSGRELIVTPRDDKILPTDKSGREAGADLPAPSSDMQDLHNAPSTVIQLRPMPERRPHCLNRSACASMSKDHCHRCQAALDAQLAVETGGQSISHQGSVR